MNDKVKYWIEISDYDLKTAKAMLESKRYLYVGFMCHQVIEKTLKAYFEFLNDKEPPYTHNLTRLLELTNLKSEITPEQENFIFEVQPLNIRARYTSYKDAQFKFLKGNKCREILNNTKDFHKWIKTKLKEN